MLTVARFFGNYLQAQEDLQPALPGSEAASADDNDAGIPEAGIDAPAPGGPAIPRRRAMTRPNPPPVPVRERIQGLAGSFERFIVRHRTSSALLFAYCSFFWKLCGEFKNMSGAPVRVQTEFAAGSMFVDSADDEPLTKASVLSRVGMRREVVEEVTEEDADTIALFEESLRVAASQKDPNRRAMLLAECYAALGHIHSARGHYYEMLHAMSLALRSGADANDTETLARLQVAFGHLEFKHHRYFAAGTRFEDALQINSSDATRTEALAGLGWAALAQGGVDAAGRRFVQALDWMPSPISSKLSISDAASAVSAVAAKEKCIARLDANDGVRVLSLAGLAVANERHDSGVTGGKNPESRATTARLLECAVFLFQDLPVALQQPHLWRALGLARHAIVEATTAKKYHKRAALAEPRDATLTDANPKDRSCATAADLSSCSHSALNLGLVDFSGGNTTMGMEHVELLLSRTHDVHVEAAEWLLRFARGHSWTPSGQDFTAFILGRAEPLLKGQGDARMARHFVDHGRFLLAHRDSSARVKKALGQLSRARAIVEKSNIGWTDAEIATLYNTIGSTQHQVGEMEEAVRSFENALKLSRQAAAAGKQSLMIQANLGAARLQLAGSDSGRWRLALQGLKEGLSDGRQAGLNHLDPVMKELEASLRNAVRLAHHRGILGTCAGPLSEFLYGVRCPSEA